MPDEVSVIRNKWMTERHEPQSQAFHVKIISDNGQLTLSLYHGHLRNKSILNQLLILEY